MLVVYFAEAQVFMGVKAGLSIPDLEGNNEQSRGYTSRQGGYGGVLINFKVNTLLSVQTEVNYSPQGGQRKGIQPVPADAISGIALPPGVNLYANFKNTTILSYVEIPVMLKLELGKKLRYYTCLGPYMAFLIESRTETRGSSLLYFDAEATTPLTVDGSPIPAVSFNSDTDIKKSIKTFNGGGAWGLGLKYPVRPGHIFIEGRIIRGFTNIQTHPERDGKNKTGSLTVALGYLIKIRRLK